MDTLSFEARFRVGRFPSTRPVHQPGFWAATLAASAGIAYSLAAALLQLDALSPPWDAVATLVPSLLLAPSFVVLPVCVHSCVPNDRRQAAPTETAPTDSGASGVPSRRPEATRA
jgi:hypothetical protein